MKRKYYFLLLVLLLSGCILWAHHASRYSHIQSDSQPAAQAASQSATQKVTQSDYTCMDGNEDWFLPKIHNAAAVVHHTAYTLEYSEPHEQALWVAYLLTAQHAQGSLARKDCFQPDPDVKTQSASLTDYKKSGYDRGHLAPLADMRWNSEVMRESFLLSNMSPQTHSFNAGIWSRMEKQVRQWAIEYDSLYVVTGPVLGSGLSEIGPDGVDVPKYFYKVILDMNRRQAIGILMKHEESKSPLRTFAVSVDKIENITGLDFFPALADSIENELESHLCIPCWNWE